MKMGSPANQLVLAATWPTPWGQFSGGRCRGSGAAGKPVEQNTGAERRTHGIGPS